MPSPLRSRQGVVPLVLLLVLLPSVVQAHAGAATAIAVRAREVPHIDGRLDDPVWLTAAPITDFRQREPQEGSVASEATEVRILYDDAHLYVAANLHDSRPEDILATTLKHDGRLDEDDSFALLLDTYHDHRNAFLFRVNPNGARLDAIIRNESTIDHDWDEQWTAAASVDAHGWTVEIAIPFSTLRFPRDPQTWGVNFERIIRRKNEETSWTNWSRDFRFEHVSQAGVLEGLEGISQRGRVRLRPYVTSGLESLRAENDPRGVRALRGIGLDDVKVAVTPNLTADFAVNPDFAQTEMDEQRVNLTRFSLFFPEKRQFFIEGAESLRMGAREGEWDDKALELFHSRRIGLSQKGQPLPLIAGGKLTGKVRGFELGVLGARVGGDRGVAAESFGVARFRRELLGRSYVGAIATTRNDGGPAATTFGADARFVLKQHLEVTALAARARERAGEPQWARQLAVRWDDDLLDIGFDHLAIDPQFRPALGYVRRSDRRTEAAIAFSPRPRSGPVRQLEFSPGLLVHHDARGALLTAELSVSAEANFQSGDELEVSLERTREVLPDPFEIDGGVVLGAARYEWQTTEVTLRSSDARRVGGGVSVERGGFYNGRRREVELSLALRLGRWLRLAPEYEMNDVDLPEGAFTTHLGSIRADIAFGLNWSTSTFVQYNTEGRLSSIQTRLDRAFRDVDHFYVVFNQTRFTGGPFAGETNRSLLAKLTYSIRF